MSAAKSYFTPVFVLLAMLVLIIVVGYFSWQVAATWFNSPTPGITTAAPLPSVTAAPITPQQSAAPHQTNPDDFLGVWTGKWDNTYALQLTIARGQGQQFRVLYEHEETPGQPLVQRQLHPIPQGRLLRMTRASMIMTLSESRPNTARLDGNFEINNALGHHTATLTRSETSAPPDIPPVTTPAATQP